MRLALLPAMIMATPALADSDETVTRGIWGIVVIVVAFIILALIGSRR